MRTSLILSLVFHGLVLSLALIGFGSSTPPAPPPTPSLSVGFVTAPSERSAVKAGKRDAPEKTAALSTPPVEKAEEAVETASEPKPSERVAEKQAALPPPKPKSQPPQQDSPKTEPEAKAPPKAKAPEPESETKSAAVPAPIRRPRIPQKQQVAEVRPKAEPEPVRREEKPRPDRIADLIDERTPQAEGTADFDPDRISALLNRDPTAGGRPQQDGPRRPWRQPSTLQEQASGLSPEEERQIAYGAPQGQDERMSANEVDAFRAQISRCWTPPVGGLGGASIIVKLRITLNEDGSLVRPPQISNHASSPFFRPAADSAVRAVMQCQPYAMPIHKYRQWRDMLLTFDPSRMYGG